MTTRRYVDGDELHAEDYNALLDTVENINWRPIKVNNEEFLDGDMGGSPLNLIAGDNITLSTNQNGDVTITSTGGGVGGYVAGDNIEINGNVISAIDTKYQASDFDIKDLSDITGLRNKWNNKQDALTAGDNISITTEGGVTRIDVVDLPQPGSNFVEGDNINFAEDGSGHTAISALGYTFDETKTSFATGLGTLASGRYSYAEGSGTTAQGNMSHAEGCSTKANGTASHAEGHNTETGGNDTYNTKTAASEATGSYAHAEGNATIAKGPSSHAEGKKTFANGVASHTEGQETTAQGNMSHAEGNKTFALGINSHAEGEGEIIYITCKTAESGTTTYTITDVDNGYEIIIGDVIGYRGIFAKVINIVDSQETQHGIPYKDVTLSESINPDFKITSYNSPYVCSGVASGKNSHSEGYSTKALAYGAHTEGYKTEAFNECEHAEGSLNVSHKNSEEYGDSGNTQHSVGIGDWDDYGNEIKRNALEIMQNGDVYVKDVGGYDGVNYSGATRLQDAFVKVVKLTQEEYDALVESGEISETTLYIIIAPSSVTITFVDYDGTVLQSSNVEYGAMPVYTGETPTREDDYDEQENLGTEYTFSDWYPVISAATANTTYTAQYSTRQFRYVTTDKFIRETSEGLSGNKEYLFVSSYITSTGSLPIIVNGDYNSNVFNVIETSTSSVSSFDNLYEFVLSGTTPTTFIAIEFDNEETGTFFIKDLTDDGYIISSTASSGSNVFKPKQYSQPTTQDGIWVLDKNLNPYNITYGRYIRYNQGSPRFAPYKTGQNATVLFYKTTVREKKYINNRKGALFTANITKTPIAMFEKYVIAEGPDEEDRNSLR